MALIFDAEPEGVIRTFADSRAHSHVKLDVVSLEQGACVTAERVAQVADDHFFLKPLSFRVRQRQIEYVLVGPQCHRRTRMQFVIETNAVWVAFR